LRKLSRRSDALIATVVVAATMPARADAWRDHRQGDPERHHGHGRGGPGWGDPPPIFFFGLAPPGQSVWQPYYLPGTATGRVVV